MLVLSRDKDETVTIGQDIEVKVVDVRGNTVRLGFTAPRHVPIHRKEVLESMLRERRAAASIDAADLPRST